jgi:hypothetical protein
MANRLCWQEVTGIPPPRIATPIDIISGYQLDFRKALDDGLRNSRGINGYKCIMYKHSIEEVVLRTDNRYFETGVAF